MIDVNASPTHSFEWGMSRWHVTPATTGSVVTFGEAWLPPGDGHGRHNHVNSEEILYVLSGTGWQTIEGMDPECFEVHAGDVVFVPRGAYHSTIGTGWEPLRLIVVHAPGGAEADTSRAPGFVQVQPGSTQTWRRGPVQ